MPLFRRDTEDLYYHNIPISPHTITRLTLLTLLCTLVCVCASAWYQFDFIPIDLLWWQCVSIGRWRFHSQTHWLSQRHHQQNHHNNNSKNVCLQIRNMVIKPKLTAVCWFHFFIERARRTLSSCDCMCVCVWVRADLGFFEICQYTHNGAQSTMRTMLTGWLAGSYYEKSNKQFVRLCKDHYAPIVWRHVSVC